MSGGGWVTALPPPRQGKPTNSEALDPGSTWEPGSGPALASLHCTFLVNDKLRQGKKSVD